MPKVRSAEDLKLQQQEALEKEFLLMPDGGSAEYDLDFVSLSMLPLSLYRAFVLCDNINQGCYYQAHSRH